jgi:hypothetical protein
MARPRRRNAAISMAHSSAAGKSKSGSDPDF